MNSSNKQQACLFRAKYIKRNAPICHYSKPSLWPALKSMAQTVWINCLWQIGTGANNNFWKDKWLSSCIIELLQIPDDLHDSLKAQVANFIQNRSGVSQHIQLQNQLLFMQTLKRFTFLYLSVKISLFGKVLIWVT